MKTDETTIQNTTDDDKVTGLLSALPRVDAPNDFDFRVRARIAAGAPAVSSGFRLPVAVRYAVPLLLLIAVAAYFGFTRFYSLKDADVPQVVENQPPVTRPGMPLPGNDGVAAPTANSRDEQAVVRPSIANPVAVPGTEPKVPADSHSTDTAPGGGSQDHTDSIPKRTFPRGLDPTHKPLPKPKDFENDRGVTAKSVLSFMGIDVDSSGPSMTVRMVHEHSPAGRAGVKTGDVVVALNDEPVSEKTSFHGKFTGKSLRVRRDGKDVEITLKP